MTPEEKSLLERTYKMAEENNEILRSIRRASRWSLILRVVYWVVVLGFAVGAYYFIQPYVQSLMNLTGEATSSLQNLDGSFSSASKSIEELRSLLK